MFERDADEDDGCSLCGLSSADSIWPFVVEEREGLGRCWIATRDIGAGEEIEHELPLIWWDETPIATPDNLYGGAEAQQFSNAIREACSALAHDNVVNLLVAYAIAPEAVRLRCDNFAVAGSPDEAKLISELTSTWTRIGERLFGRCKDGELLLRLRSVENVVLLLTRSHINAHSMDAGHAMLEVASKSNHACWPNASYAPCKPPCRSGRSHMRVFAIRDIPAGAQIFTTYIGGLDMASSTRRRRAKLLKEKAFFCRCARCSSTSKSGDLENAVQCPGCGRTECVRYDVADEAPTYCVRDGAGRSFPWPWLCAGCGRRWWDGEVVGSEEALADRILVLRNSALAMGRPPPLVLTRLALAEALQTLAQTHHLVNEARIAHDMALEARLDLLASMSLTSGAEEIAELVQEREKSLWAICVSADTLMWKYSPVVVANLVLPRLTDLLTLGKYASAGEELGDQIPSGIPRQELADLLKRVAWVVRLYFGREDKDAERLDRAAGLAISES
ncbi:hypothetical protein PYCC9005_000082 [Savitreella phatthalungensis]